jgi:gamma-glutamyltranspeptidase
MTGATTTGRPAVSGRHRAVPTGHWLATSAAVRILECGGNAIDAGDLAAFRSGHAAPEKIVFGEWRIYSFRPWRQAPVLLEFFKVHQMLHGNFSDINSASYGDELIESMKLDIADREACFGDPEDVVEPWPAGADPRRECYAAAW